MAHQKYSSFTTYLPMKNDLYIVALPHLPMKNDLYIVALPRIYPWKMTYI